ncbi:hypothetical protein TVAG_007470 [Trichomonas vaginalis G3]|uniref:Uncharacterized protein n=1 Tax=Trichomonas vaginalis (strain ATCC PRA-98 / G3) TaxID=412133 RepID=A2FQ05_TRIV3|nr:single helix bin domain-containing protein [Trichomonas vaginalis G3]EAX93023.1 hypothetical protein TVAG_007470 [Trichomonas vaginalis G3]KAI5539604.1 single helix bin domain-containing protein [Trichomonas vaginalis G3]|eukprot:XP_001305953.1 hypothetical protein [Trichomonas vaginalis G3]
MEANKAKDDVNSSSSEEEEIPMAAKREGKIKILDPHKQTAKKTGPPATPRELRLIKTSHKYLKRLEESNVALEELKQQITKQAEELQQKNEFITLLKTKLDYKDEEISDLRSRVDQLGRQSDMWHERFITANSSYKELKHAVWRLGNF